MARQRNYLLETEVERLIAAAKSGPNAARDGCLILLMFRHGLRVSGGVRARRWTRWTARTARCTCSGSRTAYRPCSRCAETSCGRSTFG